MSFAVGRRSVPLKNMCSAKCAIPFVSRVSYREPAASMTMQVTDWAWSTFAVTTRSPLSRVRRSKTAIACHAIDGLRSEEHTSELQSLRHLVCRLLLEKKKKTKIKKT